MSNEKPLFEPVEPIAPSTVMVRVSVKNRDRIAALALKYGRSSNEVIEALLERYGKENF
jgi:predicted HicB family RNase H-like nuclease